MAEEILEPFSPTLSGEGQKHFNHIISNLAQAYPSYMSEFIHRELEALQYEPDDIDMLKYHASLSALYDLTQQGWSIEINKDKLFLRISDDSALDKAHVRYRLASERSAQFQDEAVLRFIARMEKIKTYNGQHISIRNLIGDPHLLLDAINCKDAQIVQPYIQLVTHARDEHTGYYYSEIWRYFRYTWSIPYKSMPGRNLFYLVRDARQPFHPIIGIFALGNSVLNLTVRDNEIGWTVEAIKKQMKRKEKTEISDKPIALLDNLHRLTNCHGSLNILAGQQPDGEYQSIDLAKAPHMLIAGTTGSGKTIFLYSIIVSLLSQLSADELELLIIDPKQTDFHFFEGLPCLRGNRVLVDAEAALEALEQINAEDKEQRTLQIRTANSRDIDSYNAKNPTQKMKRLVVVIDEYADLVQAAELQGKDVRRSFEANLCMLAQRVRNLGIHLVIATQQPRATIVTSSLKAVLPFRVSFRLPSHVDSQTILDRAGAEDLLGKGDMLMQTDSDLLRLQGFYISEEELISFLEGKQK